MFQRWKWTSLAADLDFEALYISERYVAESFEKEKEIASREGGGGTLF